MISRSVFLISTFLLMCSLAYAEEAGADGDGAPTEAKISYYEMHPPFVTNIQSGSSRHAYLLVKVEIMGENQKIIDEVRYHEPQIRNNLVMLFSAQTLDGLQSRKSKLAIQQQALENVQHILNKEKAHGAGVKRVLFTRFLIE